MKKLIMLIIAVTFGVAGRTFATSYTIPNQTPTSIDLKEQEDSVAFESLLELATHKSKVPMPFIMAVVLSGDNKHPFYYDAKTIMEIHNKKPVMENPDTREKINHVYFFTLKSPTDPRFTYLCSDKELFHTAVAKYRPIFDAYIKNNKRAFDAAFPSPTTAQGTFTTLLTPKFLNVSTKTITIENNGNQVMLSPGHIWYDKIADSKLTIKCPTFKPVTIDLKKHLKPGTLYVALDAGTFLFGSKIPQPSKIGFKPMTKAEAQRAYPQLVK